MGLTRTMGTHQWVVVVRLKKILRRHSGCLLQRADVPPSEGGPGQLFPKRDLQRTSSPPFRQKLFRFRLEFLSFVRLL